MDADEYIPLTIERVTEPFSGMTLLRVSGFWQGPATSRLPLSVEVRYDGNTANCCPLAPGQAPGIPPGHIRFNIGTQLPLEAGVREVAVVLVAADGERVLYRRLLREVGTEEPAS